MPPSAELVSPKPPQPPTVSNYEADSTTFASSSVKKMVAFAVNYEPSMVDRYWHTTPSYKNSPSSTKRTTQVTAQIKTPSRSSKREQKPKTLNLTSIRVRYDMALVPVVEKNKRFWETVGSWPNRKPLQRNKNPPTNSASKKAVAPFNRSVVWIPNKRKEWEDSISELTSVCTSAAQRRHTGSKVFVPPLSREYIRDRIDIDDPLNGYQIRHQTGGWLQGFVLWTNFTTWNYYFAWDSLHSKCGLNKCNYVKDANGSLAKELDALPRSGDPGDSGIVFPNIAEISLLGGLGCGELLLRMALQDIRKHPQYQYIALQATNGSRSFYERFGFKRVGAVCRYGKHITTKGVQSMLLSIPTEETPISGYRHWTHANESPHSLELHGGPSYMMCLKLPTNEEDYSNLLEALDEFIVADKPRIEVLGAAATPGPSKRKLKKNMALQVPAVPSLASANGPNPSSMVALSTPDAKPKRVYDDATMTPSKRRKISEDFKSQDFFTPPPAGQPMSYAQKQYQSVWLAVPPTEKTTNRKPPNSRSKPSKKSKSPKPSTILPNTPNQQQVQPTKSVQTIDKAILCKQKVKSYPRDRLHFYNKVVQRKSSPGAYFFVLHYGETSQQITIVPMAPKGVLSGKRQGRPRFQCVLQETSKNWKTASTKDYEPVSAFMVMKTPIIAQEAWDILGA